MPPATPRAAFLTTIKAHFPASHFTHVFLAIRTRIGLSSPNDEAESIHICNAVHKRKEAIIILSFASHTFTDGHSENLH